MDKPAYSYTKQGQDDFCYPGTTVLINLFNIRAAEHLAEVERKITADKILTLEQHPIQGVFDLTHLRSIHRFIFEDIYPWAGELRQGDFLAKGSSLFCLGRYIEQIGQAIAKELKSENHLKELTKPNFINRLAYYMGEINALHPFREGNGRTQRAFFRQLAMNAGYDLDYSVASPQDFLEADIAAFQKEYHLLKLILRYAVSERDPSHPNLDEQIKKRKRSSVDRSR